MEVLLLSTLLTSEGIDVPSHKLFYHSAQHIYIQIFIV